MMYYFTITILVVGYGDPASWDEYVLHYISFTECIATCKNTWEQNNLFNGMQYEYKYKKCWCNKNQKGLDQRENYGFTRDKFVLYAFHAY